MNVVIWTVAGGTLVFALGLVSALSAQKQQRNRQREKRSTVVVIEHTEDSHSIKKEAAISGGMNLAARGTENLVGAGQGK
jgi:hypothetical protein